MKPRRLPVLIGLSTCLACVQPASHWEPLAFHGVEADEFAEAWTFGEVTGVTPEAYEVRLDRAVATSPGGSVRFEGNEGAAYHTMWVEHVLPNEDAAFLLELTWNQYLEDEAVQPLVWVRLDGEDGMLGMTDSRSLERTKAGMWQTCTLEVAIPVEAREAVIGVGMMGQGAVRFDRLRKRMGTAGQASPASLEARSYVDSFLTIVEAEAMRKDHVDWEQMHRDMTSLIRDAVTPADTYPAIRFCLDALGDHHSRLLTPSFLASNSTGDGEEPHYRAPQRPHLRTADDRTLDRQLLDSTVRWRDAAAHH